MSHNIGYIDVKENADRKKVMRRIQEEADRYGDGYPGGVKWHDAVSPLKDRESAKRWIDEHDNGWYDDHAVRYYDCSANKSKKTEEIEANIKKMWDKICAYEKAHAVQTFKAEYISCPKCGSKLKRELLRTQRCPVCGSDLRSKTTIDTLAGYRAKHEDLQKKLADEKAKQKGPVMWLVKYEYHS